MVEGLRRGDEAACRELVRRYQHRVFTIVYRYLGNRAEAEDLTQDVLISIIRTVGSFRGESLFSTWLYRVTVNHAKNQVKYLYRRRAKLKVAWDATPGWEPQPASDGHFPTVGRTERLDDASVDRELLQRALAALERLEPEFREALVLREIEGMSYDRIAEVTGVPEGTVKSRIHRARAALHDRVMAEPGRDDRRPGPAGGNSGAIPLSERPSAVKEDEE
jgi:RNA polymerase sigma-70 factor (ECF subfamily)